MKLTSLEAVFRSLNDAGVRYLVAGGVAVNAHGYQRLTQDLDVVLDMQRENVERAIQALERLGFRPLLPVPAIHLADPAKRREWNEERNVEVFSLVSDAHRETTIDIFVREPFDFGEEYASAMLADVAPSVPVPFVGLRTLVAMKEATGRPRDEDDARHLRWILEERDRERDT